MKVKEIILITESYIKYFNKNNPKWPDLYVNVNILNNNLIIDVNVISFSILEKYDKEQEINIDLKKIYETMNKGIKELSDALIISRLKHLENKGVYNYDNGR